MQTRHHAGLACLLATALFLSACKSRTRPYVLFDDKSSSNVRYTIDYDRFPKDHWAYDQVKATEHDVIVVILSAHDSDQTLEQICETDGLAPYLIAERTIQASMLERMQLWRALEQKRNE